MTDFRQIADVIALIRSVPPVVKIVPPTTTQDPASGETIEVPGYTAVTPPLAKLPAALKTADGQGLALGATLGLLWGAVWQILNREQRVAIGRATVTSGIWTAGSTHDVPVSWDSRPAALPKDGIVTVQPAIAWLGRTTARVKPDSIDFTGCVLTVTALQTVAPVVLNPITYEVQASFDYYPPYEETP